MRPTTACKSLQIVANFDTNLSTLLATPFSEKFTVSAKKSRDFYSS
jgi:hypothetical protein